MDDDLKPEPDLEAEKLAKKLMRQAIRSTSMPPEANPDNLEFNHFSFVILPGEAKLRTESKNAVRPKTAHPNSQVLVQAAKKVTEVGQNKKNIPSNRL